MVLISHDVSLLEATVNRVLHLNATRAVLDVYNVGWKVYLDQREADERRRKRERANAERKATSLQAQADRMRYKATKATAAQNMEKRAHKLLAGLEEVRKHDKVAKLRFPDPAPCGKVPLSATGLSKSYGSLEVLPTSTCHRQGQPGCHPGFERRGQDDVAAHPGRRRNCRHR